LVHSLKSLSRRGGATGKTRRKVRPGTPTRVPRGAPRPAAPPRGGGDDSPAAARRLDRLKTAAYTVQRPLHLGASLAGADDRLIATLLEFGGDVGVAFQLRDDLLGVFGDPSVTGKPAGDDLREGKRTLLVALGLQLAAERGDHAAAKVIADAIGAADLTNGTVDQVREALTSVGAVAAVERQIDELTASANAALERAHLAEPAPSALAGLIRLATQRNF
ncbi:polyprenyl synthetase family protein, partial [Amycolatopsis sp. NPDC059090]|uniref:polyprenyl synthetase family protein n=1 Tax=Amycolatopsis sp. NPDC059090 TaxID=3346723 RepID=UPI00366AF889